MNEDHALSLYAIVQSTLNRSKISGGTTTTNIKNCNMTSIDLDEMKISYVTCNEQDGTCSRPQESIIAFDPPLKSLGEARSRLVQMHHECLAPRFSWLITEPICQTILLSMSGLGYAHYFVDIPQVLQQDAMISSIIGSDRGSKWGDSIEYAVKVSWMFGVFAHLAEAVYVAYICKMCLKMSYRNVISWFIMVTLVGYPMTSKVLQFRNVQQREGGSGANFSTKKKQ